MDCEVAHDGAVRLPSLVDKDFVSDHRSTHAGRACPGAGMNSDELPTNHRTGYAGKGRKLDCAGHYIAVDACAGRYPNKAV